MRKSKKKRQTSGQRGLPEPDYSLPDFNDPARLREWINVLGITQSELAHKASVSQSFISAIERGATKFSEPSRTKIWRAIFRLNVEQHGEFAPRMWRGMGDSPNLKNLQAIAALPNQGLELFKTPMELRDEEIELLKRDLADATKERDALKQLVDMNLVDLCAELGKKLADAHQQIADFHRLFALKGAAVAGDELQEQIAKKADSPG